MNFLTPVRHVALNDRPGGYFEKHALRASQWVLLVDGIRKASSYYMRGDTAELELRDRMLSRKAQSGPNPANWKIVSQLEYQAMK